MRPWISAFCVVVFSVASLAQSNEPATQPSDQTKPTDQTDPFDMTDGGVIQLPDGSQVNLADLTGGGVAGVMVMRSIGSGGSSVQVIDEQGRKIKIKEDDSEIVVTVKEEGADPVEYRAASADELQQNHPEAFELYERFSKPEVVAALPDPQAGAMFEKKFQFQVGGHGRGMQIEALGTTCAAISDDFVKSQLGDGVIVTGVSPDSLGEKLGLKRHDLIKSINGKPVDSPQEIEEALLEADKVTIELIRAGKPLTLEEK